MSRVLLLKTLARMPVDDALVNRVTEWLDADWESHDVDRDAVRLIRRLNERVSELMTWNRELRERLARSL